MIQTTVHEAQTRLPELVHQARAGEKVILTYEPDGPPIAEIIAIRTPGQRILGPFYDPNFEIPPDFDELDPEELKLWNGEGD